MTDRRLVVFPGDPIIRYARKGEIKPRYWNPGNIFSRVDICSFADEEVEPSKVQELVGDAELHIHPLGTYARAIATLPIHLARTEALVRELRPAVIRAHGAHVPAFYASRIGTRLGISVITSLHGDYDEIRSYPDVVPIMSYLKNYAASRLFERYALPRTASVICVTGFLEHYARKYGASRVEIIYNRVDTRKFSPREHERAPGPLRLLCIGRLNKQKNQECLIEAVRGLDVEFRLVGSDSEEYAAHLHQLVQRYGMADRIEFKPSVKYAMIEAEYHWADVFAIATKFEGFCIPVLEAMACGLPVVAADIPPLAEIMGGTGIRVDIAPQGFRDAFVRLSDDTEYRQQLGSRARERALTLDGGEMERREQALYEEFMEAPGLA